MKYTIQVNEYYIIENQSFTDKQVRCSMVVPSMYVACKLYENIVEWVKNTFYNECSWFQIELRGYNNHCLRSCTTRGKLSVDEYTTNVNKWIMNRRTEMEKELEDEN